jgi:hypothetical protein
MQDKYPAEAELIAGMRNQYHQDPFFQWIMDSPKDYQNFEVNDGLIRIRLKEKILLCIPDIQIKEHTIQEIIISQAHSLLAHLA